MSLTSIPWRRFAGVMLVGAVLGSSALNADSTTFRLYRITTETGMPHLEENLRNLTTRETRCLAQDELFTAFPILEYAAFRGCRLARGERDEELVWYELVCDGTQQTTGRATWRRAGDRFMGMLNVKLGGKNMTLYQRVTAAALGECSRG